MAETIQRKCQVPRELSGKRFDQVACQLFPEHSRARLQGWIKTGSLQLGNATAKPNSKVAGGEWVELNAELEREGEWQPQALELDVVYEDKDLMVINKAAGVVVHPAAGNLDGTLLNAVLHHAPQTANIPRAGIVHRLDKDTSGLMVVAKTLAAQTDLVRQLQARTVARHYQALALGNTPSQGRVDEPIGRHPAVRTKMAVVANGKPAVTHYRLMQRVGPAALLEVRLETGRTHQIRVHMAHLGFPLVGDRVYGKRNSARVPADAAVLQVLSSFSRQALHAARLGLKHPRTGEFMQWSRELPQDFQDLLKQLQAALQDGGAREQPSP